MKCQREDETMRTGYRRCPAIRRSIRIGALALMALSVGFALTGPSPVSGQEGPQVKLSDDIKATLKALPLIQGAQIDDRTFDQKVVVVTFFASWCAPCREEFKHLAKLHAAYHDLGVEIIAVNYFEDFDNLSNTAQLKRYLEVTAPPFTVVKGSDELSRQFGEITRIPTLFVFDKQGQRALYFFNRPDGSQPSIDLATLRQVIMTLI